MWNGHAGPDRHHTGLGGFGIAAVYLQQRLNWRSGYVLLAADGLIFVVAFLFLAPLQVLLSVFAIICLNIVLALYHKPGRYAGF